jgi:vacuolar protein sorting-associated protein 35
MTVFDELIFLENHFMEERKNGRKMSDLYESVQHAAHIVPRLYLIITVGSAYIKTKEAKATYILKDCLDMVKGVQQPIRGLFLRFYLLKTMKDLLPDNGSEYEDDENDITDAVDFILKNFKEMNRLWIRLQYMSAQKDDYRKEEERDELKTTVGENIYRLSSLNGLTVDLYKAEVLPKILETLIVCEDVMSHQFLIECLINSFPDEFHLATLQPLLEGISKLHKDVDIKTTLITLLDRLSEVASEDDTTIFNLVQKYIEEIFIRFNSKMESNLVIQVSLLNFCIKCYPKKADNINSILESSVNLIKRSREDKLNPECMRMLVKLLSIPLDTLSLRILEMPQYPMLLKYMAFSSRRTVSLRIVKAVFKSKRKLDNLEIVNQLLSFIEPLLKDDEEGEDEVEAYEFEEEQESVAKMLHLISNDDLDAYYNILQRFKKELVQGGIKRMKYTMPSYIFNLFKFIYLLDDCVTRNKQLEDPNYAQDENQIAPPKVPSVTIQKVFYQINELLGMITSTYPEVTLRLFCQAAQVIDRINNNYDLEDLAYDFISTSLIVYQDELSDSEEKLCAIKLIVATISHLECFDNDNYDTLATNAAQYCNKLLRKPDQCESITLSTHMFTNKKYENPESLRKCFAK